MKMYVLFFNLVYYFLAALRRAEKDKGKSVRFYYFLCMLFTWPRIFLFQLPDRTLNVPPTTFLRCFAWTWRLGPELRSQKNLSNAIATAAAMVQPTTTTTTTITTGKSFFFFFFHLYLQLLFSALYLFAEYFNPIFYFRLK